MKNVFLLFIISIKYTLPLYSQEISLDDVKSYVGKHDTVKVCGKIFNGRYLQNVERGPTLLNIGGFFPNQKLTAVIFEEDRKHFPQNPETYFSNTNVCITGLVIDYNGKPEIVLKNRNQIVVQGVKADFGEIAKADDEENDGRVQYTNAVSNLRSGPSLDFPVVSVVPAGSMITVFLTNNGWSRVKVKLKSTSKTLTGYMKNTVFEK